MPLPSVKSPPWIMKLGMMRWKMEPLYHSGLFLLPIPFSPVHSARKFSTVLGTVFPNLFLRDERRHYRPITILPAFLPSISISKNTLFVILGVLFYLIRRRRRKYGALTARLDGGEAQSNRQCSQNDVRSLHAFEKWRNA